MVTWEATLVRKPLGRSPEGDDLEAATAYSSPTPSTVAARFTSRGLTHKIARNPPAPAAMAIKVDSAATIEGIVKTIHDCKEGVLSLTAYRLYDTDWIVVRVDAPVPLHVVQTLVEPGINVTHLAPPSGRHTEEAG